jgi:ACS family hexuronate transporter-like MFS transporter
MKPDKRRWIICGLLFLATLLNYLDRQTISVTSSKIAAEMHLTDGALGQLFSAFLFAYGISQLVVGMILDRLGVALAYAIAVVAWSLAGASSALTTTFGMLFVTRLLLGVCEAPNWPLALRVVGRVFPAKERALASGLFQSGTSIGALVAPPVIIALTTAYNWRLSFFVVGALGLLWALLWLGWFKRQPMPGLQSAPASGEVATGAGPASLIGDFTPKNLGEILRSRIFWGLLLANNIASPLQYFYVTWLPRYFEKYAGVGFGKELAHRLIVVFLALDLGLWTGGAVVALLARRMEVRKARLTVTTIGTACMAAIPLVSMTGDLNAITAVICVATFGLGWFMVNYLSFLSEVSLTKTSTVAGLSGGTGSLTGAGFIWLVGNTVEKSGGFGVAFLMAGLLPLLALGGMWLSAGFPKTRPRALPS